jgi:hypothetical protein
MCNPAVGFCDGTCLWTSGTEKQSGKRIGHSASGKKTVCFEQIFGKGGIKEKHHRT